MNSSDSDAVKKLSNLLARHAPARDLVNSFARLKPKPKEKIEALAAKQHWLSAISSVASVLDSKLEWLEVWELRTVKMAVLNYLTEALTLFWPRSEPTSDEVESVLSPFTKWIESEPDHLVLSFCWSLMTFKDRGRDTDAQAPIRVLVRNGRLSGPLSISAIEQAIVFAGDANRMSRWREDIWQMAQWHRDSPIYLEALSNSSYVVRANAAKAAGKLFLGCATADSGSVPSVFDLMALIQETEKKTSGVAGPFLQGLGWPYVERLWDEPRKFDIRTWIIETLRESEPEPLVPGCTPLEFYAHELFAASPEAIEEFLKMGRVNLAVMAVTDNLRYMDRLSGLLARMAKSKNRELSQAVQAYLAKPGHHVGIQYLKGFRD